MLASKSSHYFFRHVDERWKNCIRCVTLSFLQSPRMRRAHDLLQRIRHCRDNMWAYCECLPILQNAKIDHFSLFTFTKIRCVYAGRFKLSTTVDVPFCLFSFFFLQRGTTRNCVSILSKQTSGSWPAANYIEIDFFIDICLFEATAFACWITTIFSIFLILNNEDETLLLIKYVCKFLKLRYVREIVFLLLVIFIIHFTNNLF